MDAPGWNGDYDREHESVPDYCENCGVQLFPEETDLCRNCHHDYLAGLRDNRRDEDAA